MALTPQEQQELDDLEYEKLVAEKAAAQRAAAPQPDAPAPRKFNPTLPMVVDGVVVGEMPLSEHNRNAAMGLRYAPVAASMAFPPAGLAAWLGLGTAAAGGELLANMVEGKKPDPGEAAAAGILVGTPVPAVRAVKGLGGAVVQGMKGAAALGTTATGANVVKRAIDTEEFPTYQTLKEDLKGAIIPAGLGGIGFTGGSRLMGIAEKKAEYEARRQLLEKIGIDNPTLGLLDPPKLSWEQSVAARDPELATKLGQAQSGVTREFLARLGTDPGNPAVAQALQKMIPVVDAAEANYQNAVAQTQKARDQLREYAYKAVVPDDKAKVIAKEVSASVLNGINQQAATAFARNAAIGNAVSPSAKAQELRDIVGQLFDARKDVSKVLYDATGVPQDTPLFSKIDLIKAAKDAMGKDVAETSIGRGIVEAINGAGAADSLTANQVKLLRGEMANKFATNDTTLNLAESTIEKAYEATTETMRDQIAAQFNSDTVEKWDAAQKFWRDTSQLRDSKFGRTLLKNGETADDALGRLANDMVNGKVDELDNFKKFVEVVGGYPEGKDVAKLAMQGMTDSLRNAFIAKHTKAGSLNFESLLGDLSNASTFRDLPVPVDALNFGSVDTIRQAQRAMKQFKPGEVTARVVDDFLNDDSVRRVLSTGGKDAGEILGKEMAKRVLLDKINAEIAARHSDLVGTAREQAKQAQELISKYGIAEEQARKLYDAARSNPVLGAFSGKGSYTLTQELGKTGAGTVTDLLNTMPPEVAGKLMSSLRQNNSQLADLVERRILANELAGFVNTERSSPGATSRLDVAKVREFFNPIHDQYDSSRLKFLQNVIGRDKVSKLRVFASDLAKVDDDLRRGQFAGGGMSPSAVLGGLIPVGPGVGPSQRMTILNRVSNAMSKGAYNTVARALTDKDFANMVFNGSRGIAEAISSMPTQRAYLIMGDKPLMSELGLLNEQ